jgi:hypothetical protein
MGHDHGLFDTNYVIGGTCGVGSLRYLTHVTGAKLCTAGKDSQYRSRAFGRSISDWLW